MPYSRLPRVIGFDVAHRGPQGTAEAPLVALLDVTPSAGWWDLFQRRVPAVLASVDFLRVELSAEQLLFFCEKQCRRREASAIRQLVEQTSQECLAERLRAAAAAPVPTTPSPALSVAVPEARDSGVGDAQ